MITRCLPSRSAARVLTCMLTICGYSGAAQALDNSNKVEQSARKLPAAFAILEGSTTTHRQEVDGSIGNVYIYTGGVFPIGTVFGQMRFVFDQTYLSGYVTPLLFEQVRPNVYAVVGIGKGFPVAQSPFTQSVPFVIVEGIKIPYNTRFTFGFMNALVGVRGLPLLTSTGTVDYDPFEDGGNGIGGIGTSNAWNATSLVGVTVPLGATFGPAGSGALYPFVSSYRTYSALVTGIAP